MITVADVFVIETLDPDDEGNGRFEGAVLSQILRLHGKNPKYRYVRTRQEFEKAIRSFGKSGYRYLHISAHADAEGMVTTNQEEIDYDELADLLRPHLRGRRIFLSACSMVHQELAAEIFPNSGCYSIVGPTEDIRFTDAAVVWSSIYHLLFTTNTSKITHKSLKLQLQRVTKLFNVRLAYYSASKFRKRGYTADLLSG